LDGPCAEDRYSCAKMLTKGELRTRSFARHFAAKSKGDVSANAIAADHGVKGTGTVLDRESSINSLVTAESELLRSPQAEANPLTCGLFSSFLQRTQKSQTGWRRKGDLNRRDPSFSRVSRDFKRISVLWRASESAEPRRSYSLRVPSPG